MTKEEIKAIIKPENEIEEAICNDPEFITGASYGKPRNGHPEGEVIYHIAEVLKNVDLYSNEGSREDLRLLAILHDTFKHKVDKSKPKSGENHHGAIARRFAERYTSDLRILEILELHDDAYNAWCKGDRDKNWKAAESRADKLVSRLGDNLGLYFDFYRCDNETGDKSQECLKWFYELYLNND